MQATLGTETPPKKTDGSLILTYTGEATNHQSIDAKHYALSLLGFSNSLERISKKILQAEITIKITDEKANCWKAYSDFILSADAQAVKNTVEWLSYCGISIYTIYKLPIAIFNIITELLKKSAGKKDPLKSEIQNIALPAKLKEELFELTQDTDLREALDNMTKILELTGIEMIELEQPEYLVTSIHKNERNCFIAQPEDDIETEILDRTVSVIYLSPNRSAWKFKDKSAEYWANVIDLNFLIQMKDKRIEEISDEEYIATIKKVTTKEAGTKRVKIERSIYSFRKPLQQSPLPE